MEGFRGAAAKLLLLMSTAALSASAADSPKLDLEEGFRNPPAEARPRVWWHWMNGNITKEGVTEDLRWMKRIGIAGMQNFDASLGTPRVVEKRLAFMTPEWKDAFHHTAKLAAELDLELAIATSAGWSQTGGPWVTPEQAMKKVVWSTTLADGGHRIRDPLPLPPNVAGPFQNIALDSRTATPVPPYFVDTQLLAFRVPADELSERSATAHVTSPAGPLDVQLLRDGDLAKTAQIPVQQDGTSWVQVDYRRPTTVRGVTLAAPTRHGFGAPPQFHATLQSSVDGVSYTKVTDLAPSRADQRTVSFAPVTARSFRVVFRAGERFSRPLGEGVVPMEFPPAPKTISIAELVLHQRMPVNRFVEKAGFAAAPDYYAIDTPHAPQGSVIAKADIIDLTGKLQKDGRLDWTPPSGKWVVLRLGYSLTGHMNGPASAEATGLEVDKLNARHVRDYLNRYLDMYEQAAGKELVGAQGLRALLSDSYEAGPQNWTEGMLDEFARRRGYDARPWLPALAGWIVESAERTDRFLWDYRRTIAELLADAHYGEIKAVARERGLQLYGEALEDQRPALGDDLAMRRHTDVPMAAMWTYPGRDGPNPTYIADHLGAASVAHIYGQNIAAAESMTAFGYPWAFSPRDLQPVADLQFALGINRMVVHTSAHQPFVDRKPGMSLRPLLGQYFSRTETWAEQAGPWVDYLSRSSFLLQHGQFVADVAYFYGQEAPITGLFGDSPAGSPIEQLNGSGFDFVNEDVLLNQVRVEGRALVTRSGMRYRSLYLGGSSRRMTLPVLKRIRALAEAGVPISGLRPEESPSLADDQDEFRRIAAELPLSPLSVDRDVDFQGGSGQPRMMFLHRRSAEADIYFLTNRSNTSQAGTAIFRIKDKLPERWDARTGSITPLTYVIEGERTAVPIQLDALDSTFVVFRRAVTKASHTVPAVTEKLLLQVDGAWDVEFKHPNGARETAKFSELGSWTESATASVRYFSGTGTYRKTLSIPASARGRVILDLGEVRELASIAVNGHSVGTVWRAPFRVDVTNVIRRGENKIAIEVTNLWVNRLIGDAQPGARPQTFTTGPTYLPSAPLRHSGLLGPVRLLVEQSSE